MKMRYTKTAGIIATVLIVSTNVRAQQNGNPQGLWSAKGQDTVQTKRHVNMLKDAHVFGVLKVGPTSLSLAGGLPGGTDEIKSTNGIINFGGTDITGTTFTSNIKVGIGTQTPAFTLHLAGDGVNTNGDILSTGQQSFGPVAPTGLIGSRFIWNARKAALRAGNTFGTQWDNAHWYPVRCLWG